MESSPKTAVVLFDHGSREQGPRDLTTRIFRQLQEAVAGKGITLLRASMEPFEIWHWLPHKLQEAIEDHDAETVIALPFFLFPGKHMSEDNPAIIRDLESQYPDRRFILADPILANADLAPAVADRALQALARSPHPRQTAVLSIAHGNRRSSHAEGRTAFQTELQARIQPHAALYEETVLKFEFNNLLFRRMTPLIQKGISDFVLVPLFLASGTYTDRFIPFVLEKLRLLHPQVTTELLPPLGEYPETLQVLLKRLETAQQSDRSD